MAFGRSRKKRKGRGKSADTKRGALETLTDPKTILRLSTLFRVAGPLLAGGAMKASTSVRGAMDEQRARQLGVAPDAVAAYRGPAGPARARIAGLQSAIDELRGRRGGEPAVARFTDAAVARLSDLTAGVNATTTMAPPTRRVALRAVAADLDQLETELMTYLVGPPSPAARALNA
ncbi:hypothetical protein FDO65_18475 [Nakamurella flava]|uniref:Uncharacterized protein n=1 Tax=Nakamurella flava TaxID=2576308 RepID=A0A4U6QA91_9ACTN|nr:DUF6474 family protein [Nakamurella flava]TKV56831.1 hypothetical protein FDO65_18475 [Nakamurella flava]